MSKLHIAIASIVLMAVGGAVYLLFSTTDYGDTNADGLRLGKAAYQQGDEDNAMKWFRLGAKKGDKQAQYLFAMLYRDGVGVSRDHGLAIHWLKLAAEQGQSDAQYQLAYMLEFGLGSEHDNAEPDLKAAVQWYQKAAAGGNQAGELRLAMLLAAGRGVPRNDAAALDWAIKAAASKSMQSTSYLQRLLNRIGVKAAAGDAASQFVLARVYQQGKGLNADMKKAKNWLQKSAENGNIEAQFHLAELLMHSKQTHANGGSETQQAAGWFLKAAKQGHMQAASMLGALYARGQGVAKNKTAASQWLEKAAQSGVALAQSNLAVLYGDAKQDKMAVTWLEKAAAQEQAMAQNNLAVMYALGRGVQRDMHVALKWMTAAADHDAKAQYNLALMALAGVGRMRHDDAALWLKKVQSGESTSPALKQQSRLLLGVLYDVGYGVVTSSADAQKWYQRAGNHADAVYNLAVLDYKHLKYKASFDLLLPLARHGDAEAQNVIASMYQKGQSGRLDASQAIHWYKQAAQYGYAPAQFNLANIYRKGEGMQQQDELAVQWYAKAANQGFAPAQNALAYMYALGRGVALDRQQARAWFAKAAAQKLRIAEQNLTLLEQHKNAFTLVNHAVEVQIRASILREKPLRLAARLQVYRTAQLK